MSRAVAFALSTHAATKIRWKCSFIMRDPPYLRGWPSREFVYARSSPEFEPSQRWGLGDSGTVTPFSADAGWKYVRYSHDTSFLEVKIQFVPAKDLVNVWNIRETSKLEARLAGLLRRPDRADIRISLRCDGSPPVGSYDDIELQKTSAAVLTLVQPMEEKKGWYVPAHQLVLAMQSTYFDAMFNGEFQEGARGSVGQTPRLVTISGPFDLMIFRLFWSISYFARIPEDSRTTGEHPQRFGRSCSTWPI
ncbi:hypothetical protein BC832DRAFT_144182 [Gaertneriomyces semiglobifer]|nr:hypothetical protein BC832DRAFT_144182 [Gaertneriomyces semiglobifer]